MLDDLDKRLILELQKNARQSFTELGRKLYVNDITIRRRLKRLIEKNVLCITTIPTLDEIGYGFVGIVGIQIDSKDALDIGKQISSYANVCFLTQVTGRYDFMAVIIAKSSRDFAHFLQNVIYEVPGVSRTETFVNLNILKGKVVSSDWINLVGVNP